MKEQEKQIQEMASDMDYACTKRDLYPSDAKEIAKALYLLNYRKISEDSIILSREEYTKNLQTHYYMGQREVEEEYKIIQIPQACKEMAKNIITKIKQSLNSIETIRGDDTNKLQPEIGYSMLEVDNLLDQIEKQFNIEAK